MLGATFLFAIIFASILIAIEVNKGTLKIECEAGDVPVRIMQGDTVVEKLTVIRNGVLVRVAAGDYVVDFDGKTDGIVMEEGIVHLQRRRQRIVRIVLEEKARSLQDKPRLATVHDRWSDRR